MHIEITYALIKPKKNPNILSKPPMPVYCTALLIPLLINKTKKTTTTKIDTRGRGRQANMVISSSAVNDKWRFGTLRLDVKPDGGR